MKEGHNPHVLMEYLIHYFYEKKISERIQRNYIFRKKWQQKNLIEVKNV